MSCEFEDETFTVEDVINRAGFGKFQIRLLFLSGLGSIADACEVFILSIIGQFLACEWPLYREQIAILTYTVFIGIAIGNVVLGTLADTYGRKKVLVITAVSLFVFGFSNAFVPSFVWMVVCRSIIGFALGGASQGFTIYAEYCPANMRGKAGFYLCYFWSIGTMIVILLSWAVMLNLGSWRLLLALLSLPGLVVMVSLKWYPESARYYLVSGQYEKAVKILRKLANLNGTGLPPGRLEEVTPSKERGRLKDLLSKDYRRSTLLLWFIWLAVTLTAYGTVFISPIIIQQGFLGKIEHNNQTYENASNSSLHPMPCVKFTQDNFMQLLAISAAEFPGLLLFTFLADKFGRKNLLSVSFLVDGCLLLLLLLRTHRVIILLVLFIARGMIISLFQLIYIITLETYPTTFRAIGLGFANCCSKIGGLMVPYVTQVLVIDHPGIALGLMASALFLAAIAVVLLPFETRGSIMKDSADTHSVGLDCNGIDSSEKEPLNLHMSIDVDYYNE